MRWTVVKSNQFSPVTNILIGIVFIALGVLAFVFAGYPAYVTVKDSVFWPQVEGSVVQSHIIEEEGFDNSRSRRKLGNRRRTMFRPEVVYQYNVDGKTYTSDQIYHLSSGSRKYYEADAREVLEPYPVGRSVQVYFKPEQPEVSVLEPGLRNIQYVYLFGPILVIVIGAYVLVMKGIGRLGSG